MSAWALVTDGAIQSVGGLPRAARRLSDGAWVCPLNSVWTPEQAAACGYLPVTNTAKPADTETDTHDRSVTLVAGVPTVTWTQRPWTAAELTARTEQDNRTTIESQAVTALTNNTAFLAVNNPNTAQIIAQVQALTRQNNKIIRLVLQRFDSTD